MNSLKTRLRNLASRNYVLKRIAVAVHDTFFDRSVPMSYKIMRGICRFDSLRAVALALKRQPLDPAFPQTRLIRGRSIPELTESLGKDGFALGLTVDNSVVEAVQSHCAVTQAITDQGERALVRSEDDNCPIPGRFLYRYKDLHRNVPAVAELANDPFLLAVASRYIGCRPVLLGSRAWWSYPPPVEAGSRNRPHEFGFHYDIDDYKFLKLFVYLSAVDAESGPHVIVAGTHSSKSWFEKMNRRLRDEVAERRYGKRINIITGNPGSAFLEDTFCYHKGTSPRKKRFILEIEYGTRRFFPPVESAKLGETLQT